MGVRKNTMGDIKKSVITLVLVLVILLMYIGGILETHKVVFIAVSVICVLIGAKLWLD